MPSRIFPVLFLFCFLKCCQSKFYFKSPSYFGNTEGTKVFLNVYDRGPSQFETKRMCIKIFPLGKEHKSQSSTRGEFLLPSYIHLSGQRLAMRRSIPPDLTEAVWRIQWWFTCVFRASVCFLQKQTCSSEHSTADSPPFMFYWESWKP